MVQQSEMGGIVAVVEGVLMMMMMLLLWKKLDEKWKIASSGRMRQRVMLVVVDEKWMM